jgi:hypothetical protein
MRCLVCDAEMDLAEVVPDDTMPVPGYEHYTFRCPQCGDEERRLLFARAGEARAGEPEPSASKPPARQPDEPVLSAAALAELESQLAGLVSAVAPAQPARSRPSFWAWLGKLVTAIRSLPPAAWRRGNPSIREAPPSSAPVPEQPLPSPAAAPALEPAAVAPISSAAEPPAANPPEPARGAPDPDAVVAALAAIAALAPQPAEPASPLGAPRTTEPEVPEPVASAPAPTASGPLPEEAQAPGVAPPAAASEQTALRGSSAPDPVLTSYPGEEESISVAPHAAQSEAAAPSTPPARAPEPEPAPPPVASKPEAAEDAEDLLRRAIEILDGPTPAARPASATPLQPAAAAKSSVPPTRTDKLTHAKPAKTSLRSRAVRVERAPDDATMYLAKDIASGLTVLAHRDTAHLRKMCDSIGWEVVEE